MKLAVVLVATLAVAVIAQNNEGKFQHVKLPRQMQFVEAEAMPVAAGLTGNYDGRPVPDQMERRGGDKGGKKGGGAPPPPAPGWGWGPPPPQPGWGWGGYQG